MGPLLQIGLIRVIGSTIDYGFCVWTLGAWLAIVLFTHNIFFSDTIQRAEPAMNIIEINLLTALNNVSTSDGQRIIWRMTSDLTHTKSAVLFTSTADSAPTQALRIRHDHSSKCRMWSISTVLGIAYVLFVFFISYHHVLEVDRAATPVSDLIWKRNSIT